MNSSKAVSLPVSGRRVLGTGTLSEGLLHAARERVLVPKTAGRAGRTMRGMLNFIAGSIVGLLCFWAGWVYAHQAIATECKRLGGFFVGPVTFQCHTIEAPAPHQPPPAPPRPPVM